jgi:hypothetical protein
MLLALIVSGPEISIFPKGLVYMFYTPVVKLKSDKITLKRLCACVIHATKRNYTILYKKISTMAIKTFKVHVSTTAGTDIIDITPEIERIAAQAGDGAVLERLAPRDMSYAHDRCWGDGKLLLGT